MNTNATYESNRDKRARLTLHAQKRSQQRGISTDSVRLILSFGERSHDGCGGVRCLMTQEAVKRLESAVGRSQKVDALAGTYVVLSAEDNTVVITTGHRYQ